MKIRNSLLATLEIFLFLMLVSCSGNRARKITILETTDVHGVILPYDYIEKTNLNASLASGFTYIKKVRTENNATVLLDNGDNLQGQPEVYYYNFIDTVSPHLVAEVMNYMKYDGATVGNHDIEAGHAVYDRLVRKYNFPLMAANAIDTRSGEPYFKPYSIITKGGVRIAVLGLVTPAIPNWLPPELYSGIEFRDMVETARHWMPEMLKEKPDLVVGLFHSGWDKSDRSLPEKNQVKENGSAEVAYNVPGFDIILTGHDHRLACEKIVNSAGDTVMIIDGGSRAEKIGQVDVTLTAKKINGKRQKIITGKLVNVANYKPAEDFVSKFELQSKTIDEYVNRVIGNSSVAISSRDSYFGPSAFIDMVHSIQLKITGADVSFAAPLSFDVQISKGPVTVGDMFKLYRFENMLYTMRLSGEEIQKYLEFSYGGWFNTMKGPGDMMLKLRTGRDGKVVLNNGKAWLKNQPYNFDSAAGINYIVDLSKPEGSRITINGFTDGRAFDKNKSYKVAVNSYRGNGGGGHFTEGAGLSKDELRSRLISSTYRDLRYYILKSIETEKTIAPVALNNWKLVPEKWVRSAASREYELLFGIKKQELQKASSEN